MSRRDIPISESQSDALYRRDHSYTEASGQSFRIKWDWHRRQPRDLREAVRVLRSEWASEIPAKLHNRDLADDGTPKMTPQAESFIFDDPGAGSTPPDIDGNRPILDYYRTPVRAALAKLGEDSAPRAELISRVLSGTQPIQSARLVGVPAWCATLVAQEVLFAFMRSLSDIKIALPPVDTAA